MATDEYSPLVPKPGQARKECLVHIIKKVLEYFICILLTILPGSLLYFIHQAIIFCIKHSASTPEQAANLLASLESCNTFLWSFISIYGFTIYFVAPLIALISSFAWFFEQKPFSGTWLCSGLVIIVGLFGFPMLVAFEVGWVRNYVEQLPKEERLHWIVGWVMEFVIASGMAIWIDSHYETHPTIFTIVVLGVLCVACWGLLAVGMSLQ
jgi:hypothetical protein